MSTLARTTIDSERADSADAMALIQELEEVLDPLYPSESRHGYGVEKMLREGVDLFVLREEGVPAACGGVQFFFQHNGEEPYGELKRMYVRPQYRGRGYAKTILNHLAVVARERDVFLLRLETGIYQGEAIGLYEGWGFTRIGPFGPYKNDPLSIYYEKRLQD
ncbi:MAG: GNAT family N-acetyltransferase [Caldilineaceae bacterium]|jgi:putative acetyltransferase